MSEPLLSVKNMKKTFQANGGMFSKKKFVHAVNDVSFDIYPGETFSLVGESGCGKSTTGKLIDHLITPDSGEIWFEGKEISKLSEKEMRPLRSGIQMVFQDPYGSLDPRMTVAEIIGEGIDIHHLAKNKKERNERKARRKEQEKQWELAQTQQDILLKQVDELLEKKKTQNTRGPKVHDEEPEDFDYDEGYTDDEDDYGDYDEEQEAELDRWLAGLDDGQDEDR